MCAKLLDSHGAVIALSGPEPILAKVALQTAGFATECTGCRADETVDVSTNASGGYTVHDHDGRPEDAETVAEAVALVLDRLHPLISRNARRAMFVHAAVFGWSDGLVVVPGRSHSGKSTLAAEAVRQGADYYSDEFAVVDADGLVHPYARPIGLRADGGRRETLSAEELGGRTATVAQRPAIIVSTSYEQGDEWCPQEVTGSKAALAIIDNTVRAREDPDLCLRLASQLAANAVTLVGPRGEASEMIPALRARIEELSKG